LIFIDKKKNLFDKTEGQVMNLSDDVHPEIKITVRYTVLQGFRAIDGAPINPY
jgi:hypothetical protein